MIDVNAAPNLPQLQHGLNDIDNIDIELYGRRNAPMHDRRVKDDDAKHLCWHE